MKQMEKYSIDDSPGSASKVSQNTRLISLDAFRGLAILIMLLVNNLGTGQSVPDQFKHAGWRESIHIADMAFPWFLLCAGIAIPLSVSSAKWKSLSRRDAFMKIVRRVAVLLVLGGLLESCQDQRITIFSVGVLQTIALAYCVAMSLHGLSALKRGGIASSLLILYWAAIRFLPIPGLGQFQENHNLILYLNETFLNDLGLWGLTRIIPTSALVLIGTCVGDLLLLKDQNRLKKSAILVLVGISVTSVACVWNVDLQFNKWVWTPSYVLLTAGLGIVVLSGFYLSIDALGRRKWAEPLVILGSNAILAYALPIMVKSLIFLPLHIYMGGWGSVIPFIVGWWFFFRWLYQRKLFLKA